MGNLYWGDISATLTQGANTTMRHASGGTWEAKNMGIIHISFTVPSPTASKGNWVYCAQDGLTFLRVDSCVKASTNVEFNLYSHSDIAEDGTVILSSNLTATTTGASTTSFSLSSVSKGDWIFVDIKGVSGTPQILTVTITAQIT